MPILFSLFFCVALGARIESKVSGEPKTALGSFACASLVQALFLTPAWTTLYLASPAYAWLYRFDPMSYPQLTETGWATLGYNFASFTSLVLGLKVTQSLSRRRAQRRLLQAGTLALLAFTATLFWQRLIFLGDYEAFWLREAPPLWRVRRVWAVWVLLAAAWTTPIFFVRRSKTRLRPIVRLS